MVVCLLLQYFMSSTIYQGSGCGKLILLGEHAVVWGAPALATSLPDGAVATVSPATDSSHSNLHLKDAQGSTLATLQVNASGQPLEQSLAAIMDILGVQHPVTIDATLNVPPGAGLGSSAALAVAIARALGELSPKSKVNIFRAVAASEAIFHGSASGIDQSAAMGSGLILFQKGIPPLCSPVESALPLNIAICQAAPGASTAAMVTQVLQQRQTHAKLYEHFQQAITYVVTQAQHALKQKDIQSLGELININHGLLCAMNVSTPKLDAACHIAREEGALGAKLTGAGGGGCVYALASSQDQAQHIAQSWKDQGFSAFTTTIQPQELT